MTFNHTTSRATLQLCKKQTQTSTTHTLTVAPAQTLSYQTTKNLLGSFGACWGVLGGCVFCPPAPPPPHTALFSPPANNFTLSTFESSSSITLRDQPSLSLSQIPRISTPLLHAPPHPSTRVASVGSQHPPASMQSTSRVSPHGVGAYDHPHGAEAAPGCEDDLLNRRQRPVAAPHGVAVQVEFEKAVFHFIGARLETRRFQAMSKVDLTCAAPTMVHITSGGSTPHRNATT
jgi:hypothetical protein